MLRKIRQTKIVFTLGPATSSEAVLVKLIESGVDVCRFNMAHASHDYFRQAIANVRNCCRRAGRNIAMMMDVKGPEIRTRDVPEPIDLQVGDLVEFTYLPSIDDILAPNGKDGMIHVGVNYPNFVNDLSVGTTLLVDSGLIRMEVEELTPVAARCRVKVPGLLGSRRHINLPGVKVNMPALTEKDLGDVRVGVEEAVDLFALSFVRQAEDIVQLRRLLKKLGSKAGIVSKIEDQSGVENLEEIVKAGDGLMVARGDLGIEVPFEQLPIFQRRAVGVSLNAGKPVIIATHMLESMIQSPVPTRAEITDVSNAVRELADCVMLSGETTVGKFPERCVDALNRIIFSIQNERDSQLNMRLNLTTPKEKMLRSAVLLAEEIGSTAIMVFTRSGDLARLLSALRPNRCPIFAFTDAETTFNRMLMLWGVEPFLIKFQQDPEQSILDAFAQLKDKHWAEPGDQVVIVTNVIGRADKIIDSMQVRTVQ